MYIYFLPHDPKINWSNMIPAPNFEQIIKNPPKFGEYVYVYYQELGPNPNLNDFFRDHYVISPATATKDISTRWLVVKTYYDTKKNLEFFYFDTIEEALDFAK